MNYHFIDVSHDLWQVNYSKFNKDNNVRLNKCLISVIIVLFNNGDVAWSQKSLVAANKHTLDVLNSFLTNSIANPF